MLPFRYNEKSLLPCTWMQLQSENRYKLMKRPIIKHFFLAAQGKIFNLFSIKYKNFPRFNLISLNFPHSFSTRPTFPYRLICWNFVPQSLKSKKQLVPRQNDNKPEASSKYPKHRSTDKVCAKWNFQTYFGR